MSVPIEKEYKVLISRDQYDLVKDSYEFPIKIDQTNEYFDTPDFQVKKLNGSTRIRSIGNKKILTLKIRIDESSLYEMEKEIDFKSFDQLDDQEAISWYQNYGIDYRNLQPTYSSHTIRLIQPMEYAELCLDHTYFGDKEDYELEYEYKAEHDGISSFNKILSIIGLKYEKNCPSKIARAHHYALNL